LIELIALAHRTTETERHADGRRLPLNRARAACKPVKLSAAHYAAALTFARRDFTQRAFARP